MCVQHEHAADVANGTMHAIVLGLLTMIERQLPLSVDGRTRSYVKRELLRADQRGIYRYFYFRHVTSASDPTDTTEPPLL